VWNFGMSFLSTFPEKLSAFRRETHQAVVWISHNAEPAVFQAAELANFASRAARRRAKSSPAW
jgi:hypothetical protein